MHRHTQRITLHDLGRLSSARSIKRKGSDHRAAYQHIKVPAEGTPITANEDHSLTYQHAHYPRIEGDGIGIDISPVMIKVIRRCGESLR